MAVAAEHLVTSPGAVSDRFEDLFSFWTQFDAPDGWRVEIADGALTMTPNPASSHSVIASLLTREFSARLAAEVGVFQSVAISMPDQQRVYIPDLVVAAIALLREPSVISPPDALIAVEITSPGNARIDREEKRVAYGLGGVPLYLLIDRVLKNPTVTLFSDPVDGEYQHMVKVPFGEAIHIPAPFNFDLDTALFPR